MKVVALIFLLVLIILIFPITLKVKIDYNALDNKGLIVFYIFGIRIFIQKWKFGVNKIIFIAKNNKKSEMILFDFDGGSKYGDYLIKDIIKRIELNTLKLFVNLGVEEFSMYTAILNYSLRLPSSIVFDYIDKIKKPEKLVCQILPDFYRNSFFVAINTSVTTSLIMVGISLVSAFIQYKKKKRKFIYGKRNTN